MTQRAKQVERRKKRNTSNNHAENIKLNARIFQCSFISSSHFIHFSSLRFKTKITNKMKRRKNKKNNTKYVEKLKYYIAIAL